MMSYCKQQLVPDGACQDRQWSKVGPSHPIRIRNIPFDKTVGLGLLHISRVRLWLQTTKYSSRLSRSSRVATLPHLYALTQLVLS